MKILATVVVMLLLSVELGSNHAVADKLLDIAQYLIAEAVNGVEELEDDVNKQADVSVPETEFRERGRCRRYLTKAECKAFANKYDLVFSVDTKRDYAPGCVYKPNPRTNKYGIYWRKNYHPRRREPLCEKEIRSVCICGKISVNV